MNSVYPKEIYELFAQYVYKHAGIFYSEENYYQLEGRLKELSQLLSIHSVPEMLGLLSSGNKMDGHVHDYIVEVATNNETSFFRDGRPFDLLKNVVLPEIIKRNSDTKKISIWSAASSSGQEIYSLLMTWFENFNRYIVDWKLEVVGTDISDKVLQKARSGIYSQLDIQRGLPGYLLTKYFKSLDGSHWQIRDDLQKIPRFNHLNLIDGVFGNNMYDLVLCRNVLIYQTLENKERILNNIYKSLKPNGCLLMGAGESLLGLKTNYEKRDFPEGSCFVKPMGSDLLKVA